ncbi:unnamed protein product, partial [marine sediment metagenome]
VTIDMGYQVHGCGKTAREYGIKDPLENGVLFKITITDPGSNRSDSVFDRNLQEVSGILSAGDRFYWDPIYTGKTPRYPYVVRAGTRHAKPAPTRPTPLPITKTFERRIAIEVKHPNGQGWKWSEVVEIAGTRCK